MLQCTEARAVKRIRSLALLLLSLEKPAVNSQNSRSDFSVVQCSPEFEAADLESG